MKLNVYSAWLMEIHQGSFLLFFSNRFDPFITYFWYDMFESSRLIPLRMSICEIELTMSHLPFQPIVILYYTLVDHWISWQMEHLWCWICGPIPLMTNTVQLQWTQMHALLRTYTHIHTHTWTTKHWIDEEQ